MRRRTSRRRPPASPPVEFLLDPHDDLRVLRAIEAFAAQRRAAVVVRPTPGFSGCQSLCRDVLYAAQLPAVFERSRRAGPARRQTAIRLHRARVRELWVLRAHTIGGSGWAHLGEVAAAARVRLLLIVHAQQPCPHQRIGMRVAGLRLTVPREIRLTTDALAIRLGIVPMDGGDVDPATPIMWLPAVPVR